MGKAFMNRSTPGNSFPTPYSMTEQLFEVEHFDRDAFHDKNVEFRKVHLEDIERVGTLSLLNSELEKKLETMKCCGNCKNLKIHHSFMEDSEYTCWYQKREWEDFSNATKSCDNYCQLKG